ncbi:MAG: penicillin-binding protein [Cyclobacteriaceae bacterium]|nr:penicillin-binding protein [Cyclobacteriaceae bacterium]
MNTSVSLIGTIRKKISDLVNIQRSWFPKAIKYCWILFICFILGLPLYVASVGINLFGLFGEMPSIAEIENPENDLSSELISADGVSLGRYYRYNRSQVKFEDLSQDLTHILVISEDHRFYSHSGLDFKAFLRVFRGIITLSPAGGGSTITQQLAKNLFTLNPDHSLDGSIASLGSLPRRIVQKTKEWIISIDLERNFTKKEILAMYLNTVAFNNNAFGIRVASETYFSKSPANLDLRESALLVGMLQNPNFFNPLRRPEITIKKRNEVLAKVFRSKYKIKTRKQFDSISALDLGVHYRILNQNEGIATHFRTVITNKLKKICEAKGIDLLSSGLKIYTTIDSRLQRYAEEAVADHMRKLQKDFIKEWKGKNPWIEDHGKEISGFLRSRIRQSDTYKSLTAKYGANSDSIDIMLNLKKSMTIFTWNGERDTLFSSLDSLAYYKRFLQTGMMSMDPETGHVKAWVGGLNYKYFKFDHVQQSKRQPGSTFKPFVYGLAMDLGYSPCEIRQNISPTFKLSGGKTWTPENSGGGYGKGEKVTLRQAMARSLNSVTAQLMKELGPGNVVDFAHGMGIKSNLDTVPALCLGVSDVSLYEMVGAYGTYVNNGIYTEPFFITRIEDKNGNVIENYVPKTKQSISEKTAYKMIYMLMGGVEETGGTSEGLSDIVKENNEIGGKTGTTDNASDGWYIGVTNNLVTGVWVGGDERSIHFPSWQFGAGTKTARPIWDKFMVKIYSDPSSGIKKGKFKLPSSGLDLSLDCSKTKIDSVGVDPFNIN